MYLQWLNLWLLPGDKGTTKIDRPMSDDEIYYLTKFTSETLPKKSTGRKIGIVIDLAMTDVEVGDLLRLIEDVRSIKDLTLHIMYGLDAWIVGDPHIPFFEGTEQEVEIIRNFYANNLSQLELQKLVVEYINNNPYPLSY